MVTVPNFLISELLYEALYERHPTSRRFDAFSMSNQADDQNTLAVPNCSESPVVGLFFIPCVIDNKGVDTFQVRPELMLPPVW